MRFCSFLSYRERDFLRKSLDTTYKRKLKTPSASLCVFEFFFQYRERDLNPHSHHWPKDFKSFVSTDSTIAAQNRVQRYYKNCNYARKEQKISRFSRFLRKIYGHVRVAPFQFTTLLHLRGHPSQIASTSNLRSQIAAHTPFFCPKMHFFLKKFAYVQFL